MAFPVGSLSAADNAWLASAHDLFVCGDGGRQDEIVQQVVEYLARLPVSFLLLSRQRSSCSPLRGSPLASYRSSWSSAGRRPLQRLGRCDQGSRSTPHSSYRCRRVFQIRAVLSSCRALADRLYKSRLRLIRPLSLVVDMQSGPKGVQEQDQSLTRGFHAGIAESQDKGSEHRVRHSPPLCVLEQVVERDRSSSARAHR